MASARELLDAAYEQLDYRAGSLLDAVESPTDSRAEADWLEKGEWLSLAQSVGAEKVFFVHDNPVIVFARSEAESDEAVRIAINRVWCMARPQSLFFARAGELQVFDLTRPPIAPSEKIDSNKRLIRTVRTVADVQTALSDYHRSIVETGSLPDGQRYFSPGEARADKSLIRDLKRVRKALIDAGLSGDKAQYANSLIGRSIFIRYLEDRRILLPQDFEAVASQHNNWKAALASSQGVPLEPSMERIQYTKVLSNKAFTYALFDQIGSDFNGDLFPVTPAERQAVTQSHLTLLQRFLTGDIASQTMSLFFFAYQFDIVPIELISTIYEEFYNAGKGTDANHGTHYTPIELVEYLLSKALTSEVLNSRPVVADPACGSGIFLVEAFRRIVRHRRLKSNRKLRLAELRKILREQLRGADINEEAVKVASFSLYLAMLHHVDPPDIWREKRLPYLVFDPQAEADDANRFDILYAANSFTLLSASNGSNGTPLKFGTIDVVVGNPPWGFPKKTDIEGRRSAKTVLEWCGTLDLPVGDQELSQAFVHWTLCALKPHGTAALLVSTGVLFKDHPKSIDFRKAWLRQCKLRHIVNFAAVRFLYFNSAVAPFASVVFTKVGEDDQVDEDTIVEYWSAKHTLQAKQLRAVVLSLADKRLVKQVEAIEDGRLWKIYWWGSHHDHALIRFLDTCPRLSAIVGEDSFGQGFKKADKSLEADWLGEFKQLPVKHFTRYGDLPLDELKDVPPRVERRGIRSVYEGRRLLIKRGISQSDEQDGRIESRLATERFAFTNAINGVSLPGVSEADAKLYVGILWSSLARYYFWMTAGSWGMWHHELHEADLMLLPVCSPCDAILHQQIVDVVTQLQATSADALKPLIVGDSGAAQAQRELETRLDNLIFKAYRLLPYQCQLVRDMCEVGLNLFYRHEASDAVRPLNVASGILRGTGSQVSGSELGDLSCYLRTFLHLWNHEAESVGEFTWCVVHPRPGIPLIAICLVFQDSPAQMVHASEDEADEWTKLLTRLDTISIQHDGSRRVFVDGIIRAVGEDEIIIIKRNERRLWTATQGREDAEATIRQAMILQESAWQL